MKNKKVDPYDLYLDEGYDFEQEKEEKPLSEDARTMAKAKGKKFEVEEEARKQTPVVEAYVRRDEQYIQNILEVTQ